MKTTAINCAINNARNNQAAIPASPVGEAKPKKLPGRAYVVATPFQKAVFSAAYEFGRTMSRTIESGRAKMLKLVQEQYGETSPTYEQFRADRSAFSALALERGLVDDQVIRKPYCAAIVELFGKLPVSDSPAAVAKRLQRPVVDKSAKKAPKVDIPPTDRVESVPSMIGQFVARFGPGPILAEIAAILAVEKSTALDAKTLLAVASHFKSA